MNIECRFHNDGTKCVGIFDEIGTFIQGTITFPNGNSRQGSFNLTTGVLEPGGIYYFPGTGNRYHATKKNLFIDAVVALPNGTVLDGTFLNGNFIEGRITRPFLNNLENI